MYCKLALATLAVIVGYDFGSAQQIPSTTTAAELWNPWTWFWPYAIASAEGYRDYYQKAQKATNELYQQIYKTNAFPWITGNWGSPQTQPQQNQNGGQSNQQGQNEQGGSGAQSNQQGQNAEGGSGGQSNQQGQSTEGGSGGQSNQQGQNTEGGAGEQSKPAQDNQNPSQGGETTQSEDKQTEAEGSGAQVQGNVQDDGKTEAEVKPNLKK